jgi:hypothetical protein
MPVIFPTQARVTPSFSEPDYVVTYAQASGAFAVLPEGKPRVKIGSEDMAVYVNALDIRTDVIAGQSPSNLLPSASLVVSFVSTPTYLIRTRAIWDHHDVARGGEWNLSVPSALDLGARQGIFQQMRSALLYGFNPTNGEGLLNTVGATTVVLPPDSYGNTTVRTYDNGQMALWLLGEIVALKSGMYQSGGNIKNEIVVISPQRVFLQFSYAGIVQVTSYQRPGAGTATVGEVVKVVARDSGDMFEWHFDDTLIGQASGGNDAVILTMPEIEAPDIPGMINTNVFGADIRPQMMAVNLMYSDMSAPMKIPTPIPDGAITEINELRITSGWVIRSAGLYILSMPY